MSSIIDPNDKVITPPYDKFWDSSPTRREIQKALDHFSSFMDNIYGSIDTQHIVINLMAEKAGITKDEIKIYAQKKLQEVKDAAAHNQAAQEGSDVVSNG